MEEIVIKSKKQIYKSPEIVSIKLDNDISLELQSYEPPYGPGETGSLSPAYLQSDPYKNQLG